MKIESIPNTYNNSFKAQAVFYSLLAVLLLWIYAPARHAGFVTDFWGWQKEYDACSWWNLWTCADIKSMQHVQHLIIAGFYKIFDINPWAWTLFSICLFVIFLFCLDKLWRLIFKLAGKPIPPGLLWSIIILCAISPYYAEVLIWRVCLHYILCGIFCLLATMKFLNYLQNGASASVVFGSLFYILALGSLEISLVLPFFILPVAFYIFRVNPHNPKSGSMRWIVVIVIFLILLILYFLLSKLILGSWIGHYGAETHTIFAPKEMILHYYQYAIKHLAVLRYFPHQLKTRIFELFSSGYLYLVPSLVLALAGLVMLRSYYKKAFFPDIIGLWGFLVFLLPVSNLYIVYLLHNENDRYGFLAGSFLISALVILIFRFKPLIRYSLLLLLLALNSVYLFKLRSDWHQNGQVYHSLVEDFRWYDKEYVFVLNIPDNLEGTPLFRILDEHSGLAEALKYTRRKPFEGKIIEVALYNMIHKNNGVSVSQIDDTRLKVEMHEWGSWWWRKGQGLGAYANEFFEFNPEGKSYTLDFKLMPTNSVIIYQDGGEWKEFHW